MSVAPTSKPTVRPERCGWRDERISRWHRSLGWHLPCLDLDFIVLEYDTGLASALVELKHEAAAPLRVQHPSVRALVDLGDRAGLPVFVARYVFVSESQPRFTVTPLNEHAHAIVPAATAMTASEYIRFLEDLRMQAKKARCSSSSPGWVVGGDAAPSAPGSVAKERQIRKPKSVVANLPQQNARARDAAGKAFGVAKERQGARNDLRANLPTSDTKRRPTTQARDIYDRMAKERQIRKPKSVPVNLPEQKDDARDAAGR